MDDQEEYLIAYANLKSNLIKNQKNFLNLHQLKKFLNNINCGFPICLPDKIKYFDYCNFNLLNFEHFIVHCFQIFYYFHLHN